MPEVVTQRLDVLARVKQHRGVEVPEGVHAMFAGGLVPLARLRLGDHPSRDKSGLPSPVVEVGSSNCPRAIEAGEQQPLRDERTVRPEPRQGDLYRGNDSIWLLRMCATPSGKGTSRTLFRFGGENTRPCFVTFT